MIFGLSSAKALDIGGYYENDPVFIIKRDGGTIAGDMNRLRLKIDQKYGDNLTFHFEPRYYFLIKSQNLPLVGATGLDQLTWDRVYLKYYLPILSVTAGKQRIAWGTGYIWNPTDVFNPFVLSFAMKEEEENNVEAVRIEVPITALSGIDGYVQTGKEWNQAKKGIRGKVNVGLFDYSLSYVDLGSGGFQLGYDSVGELWGVGVRNEIALKSPAEVNSYIQSVWGWDYTLENGVGLNMEYYFNGLGQKNKDNYDWAVNRFGMDYLFFGVNKIIDEITQIRGSVIANLDDMSYIFYPQFTRNVSQNVDVSLEALLTGGQLGSEFNPTDQQVSGGFAGSKLFLIRILYNF